MSLGENDTCSNSHNSSCGNDTCVSGNGSFSGSFRRGFYSGIFNSNFRTCDKFDLRKCLCFRPVCAGCFGGFPVSVGVTAAVEVDIIVEGNRETDLGADCGCEAFGLPRAEDFYDIMIIVNSNSGGCFIVNGFIAAVVNFFTGGILAVLCSYNPSSLRPLTSIPRNSVLPRQTLPVLFTSNDSVF